MRFQHLTYELVKILENKEKTAKMRFYQSWQGHLSNSRTDTMCELLQFGKEIKMFIKYTNKK